VTIVEALPQLMAPFDPEMASILQTELESKGVRVVLNSQITAFEPPVPYTALGSDVILADGSRVPADVVILGLGVRPDTELAKAAGLKLNACGGIVVDEAMRTSAPGVWAVGDAIEVHNPIAGGEWMVALAGPANRQGRLCADNICGGSRAYKGTYGASAVRVFSLTAAGIGLNERALQLAKIPYAAVHLHPSSHASYFPGASPIALKVLFKNPADPNDPERGRLLGAQAVGADGADKAIDTLSTALQAGMTVGELADLELCYAPPIGSAKSPLNFAGMIAQDMLDGLVTTVQWSELPKLADDPGVLLLDVRSAAEVAETPLHPRARNIPIDELRGRLAELPRGKPIVTSCATGQRGYYAARILTQSGFEGVRNLDGAVKTFHASPLGRRG
jgi:rhodanese-related sulfurtransferase